MSRSGLGTDTLTAPVLDDKPNRSWKRRARKKGGEGSNYGVTKEKKKMEEEEKGRTENTNLRYLRD